MPIKQKNHRASDLAGTAYAHISAAIIVCVFAFMLIVILRYGFGALSLRFLIEEPDPSALGASKGGILTPLIGTVVLTLIGILIAFPFALATAIYLGFYAKKGGFNTLVKGAVDILSGVPTVVIALFALLVFTLPQFGFFSVMIEGVEGTNRAYGKSFLVAGITMAIMILPFVIKSMEEALKAVPASYMDASLALGATKWRTIRKVILGAARDGLTTGVILGMGRIVGDTAIVWLTLGGSIRMTGRKPWYAPENWLSTLKNGGSTLTSYIYYASPAGEGNQFDVAFGASLVLIAIILLLNLAATLIGKAGAHKNG
ncbi:MAG: phosphate ABC transporter permease PstA [Clostridiales Family XIII bacterium]|jgi:phosphate transport system permease protein|nr:phosphate ABC transporter permease PstA [Clostridiales Family XIII bacterium]